ncbi:Protein of unknown function [Bacillus thuringiensis]|nr:Protein of unknown function [Bacillus thuringiensis]
MTVILQ